MKEFKSGFVTVVGRTNAGKSSIINKIVGEKVSAVANKPQTTRKNVRAIINRPNSQIVFIDTPGIHKPKSTLGMAMLEFAYGTIPDVDLIVYVIDGTLKRRDDKTIDRIKDSEKKCILVINKVDLIDKARVAEIITEYKDLANWVSIVPLSVKKNINIDVLIEEIERNLKAGPAYYDNEEYTDQTLRELIEEIIREKALKLLMHEVPHGIYVDVERLKTRKTKDGEKIFDIDAIIYCLKESHKGIIIGKRAEMLKKIGTYAREDIEKMLDAKVNLQLIVKVKEDWINDKRIINRFKKTD